MNPAIHTVVAVIEERALSIAKHIRVAKDTTPRKHFSSNDREPKHNEGEKVRTQIFSVDL